MSQQARGGSVRVRRSPSSVSISGSAYGFNGNGVKRSLSRSNSLTRGTGRGVGNDRTEARRWCASDAPLVIDDTFRELLARTGCDVVCASHDLIALWKWQLSKSCEQMAIQAMRGDTRRVGAPLRYESDDEENGANGANGADGANEAKCNSIAPELTSTETNARVISVDNLLTEIARDRSGAHGFLLIDIVDGEIMERLPVHPRIVKILCDKIPPNNAAWDAIGLDARALVEPTGLSDDSYTSGVSGGETPDGNTRRRANSRRCDRVWRFMITCEQYNGLLRNGYRRVAMDLSTKNDTNEFRKLVAFLKHRASPGDAILLSVTSVDSLRMKRFAALFERARTVRGDVTLLWTTPEMDDALDARERWFAQACEWKRARVANDCAFTGPGLRDDLTDTRSCDTAPHSDPERSVQILGLVNGYVSRDVANTNLFSYDGRTIARHRSGLPIFKTI